MLFMGQQHLQRIQTMPLAPFSWNYFLPFWNTKTNKMLLTHSWTNTLSPFMREREWEREREKEKERKRKKKLPHNPNQHSFSFFLVAGLTQWLGIPISSSGPSCSAQPSTSKKTWANSFLCGTRKGSMKRDKWPFPNWNWEKGKINPPSLLFFPNCCKVSVVMCNSFE